MDSRNICAGSEIDAMQAFSGTFKELCDFIQVNNGLVVLDFWAKWCLPCRRLADMLRPITEEFSQVTFLRVDIDQAKDLADYYSVSHIPHLKFVRAEKDGTINELTSITGANIPEIKSKLMKFGA
jgi:thioredoxin 1